MRTKTLLLTAALGAVGLSTSVAQTVFSVNAVGFVNVVVPTGFSIIANPLKAASNKIPDLFVGVPDGTVVYKFAAATGYSINSFTLGDWDDGNQTLLPGEGAFIRNPSAAAFTVTFVGEVSQGALTHNIPKGFSLQSSEVPQSGQLDTDLKFPVAEGDVVYRFRKNNPTGYSIHSYELGDWSLAPVPDVGEGFFVKKVASTDWTRSFSVNQ